MVLRKKQQRFKKYTMLFENVKSTTENFDLKYLAVFTIVLGVHESLVLTELVKVTTDEFREFHEYLPRTVWSIMLKKHVIY